MIAISISREVNRKLLGDTWKRYILEKKIKGVFEKASISLKG